MNTEILAGANSGETGEVRDGISKVDILAQYGKEHPFDAAMAQKRYDEEKARLEDAPARPDIIYDSDEARALDLECARTSEMGGINLASNDFRGMKRYQLIQQWNSRRLSVGGFRAALEGAREESFQKLAELTDAELKVIMDSRMPEESSQEAAADKAREEQFDTKTMPIVKLGRAIRIHPYGPSSPFSSEFFDGSFDDQAMSFVKRIVAQRKEMAGKMSMGDFTVVMNYPKTESDYPVTEDGSLMRYIEMCKAFVAESGAEEGEDLVLEFGNEADVDRNTTKGNVRPFDDEAFSVKSDPIAYAKMYFDVASALKEDYPKLRCSLAGTAFYDPEWIRAVCDEVWHLSGGNDGLIDVISFHDYRGSTEEPMSAAVRSGATIQINDKPMLDGKEMSYNDQIGVLDGLAKKFHAKLTCGEVNFCEWGQDGQIVGVNADAKRQYAADAKHESCCWRSDEQIHYGN